MEPKQIQSFPFYKLGNFQNRVMIPQLLSESPNAKMMIPSEYKKGEKKIEKEKEEDEKKEGRRGREE